MSPLSRPTGTEPDVLGTRNRTGGIAGFADCALARELIGAWFEAAMFVWRFFSWMVMVPFVLLVPVSTKTASADTGLPFAFAPLDV